MDIRVVFVLATLGIVQCKLLDSCSVTKSFVNGHNKRRLELAKGEVSGQPAAAIMKYIVWDDELAGKAKKWASRNKYEHNPDTTIPSGRFQVGENIFWYGTTDKNFVFDPDMAMGYWWDEHKHYNHGQLSLSDFNSPNQIGHYTQMAWANTVRLGCAVSQYDDDNWDNNFFVVCNYGSAGNFFGEAPYEAGNEASGHLVCGESDCSKKYGNSC